MPSGWIYHISWQFITLFCVHLITFIIHVSTFSSLSFLPVMFCYFQPWGHFPSNITSIFVLWIVNDEWKMEEIRLSPVFYPVLNVAVPNNAFHCLHFLHNTVGLNAAVRWPHTSFVVRCCILCSFPVPSAFLISASNRNSATVFSCLKVVWEKQNIKTELVHFYTSVTLLTVWTTNWSSNRFFVPLLDWM